MNVSQIKSKFCFFLILFFWIGIFNYFYSSDTQDIGHVVGEEAPVIQSASNQNELDIDTDVGMVTDRDVFASSAYSNITAYTPSDHNPGHDMDSLFFNVDIKYEIAQSVHGAPMDYLPQYKNPCWISRIIPEDNGTLPDPVPWPTRLHDVYLARWRAGQNRRLRCLPAVHLLGFAKSGTSDLFKSLKQHPNLLHGKKEPLFWTYGRFVRNRSLDDYLGQFDYWAEVTLNISRSAHEAPAKQLFIDASSNSVYYLDGWRRIPGNSGLNEPKYTLPWTLRTLTPKAKYIVIIRNPTARTYSRFRMFNPNESPERFHRYVEIFIRKWNTCTRYQTDRSCAYNYTFFPFLLQWGTETNCAFFRASLYYVYMKDWLDVIPRDQFFVLRAEDYYQDRTTHVKDIFRFLGLDSDRIAEEGWEHIGTKAVQNTSVMKGRSGEAMLPETKQLLDEFFKPYNEMLADLLKDDRFLWNDLE